MAKTQNSHLRAQSQLPARKQQGQITQAALIGTSTRQRGARQKDKRAEESLRSKKTSTMVSSTLLSNLSWKRSERSLWKRVCSDTSTSNNESHQTRARWAWSKSRYWTGRRLILVESGPKSWHTFFLLSISAKVRTLTSSLLLGSTTCWSG